MILKMLSDLELSSGIKKLIEGEREILTEILHHLLEFEERKLHLKEGYGSIFQYAVQALRYSEAQAYRRISAMRLLKEIPEIEQSLKGGSLNLTHLTQAREYFKSESKKSNSFSKDEKLELLNSLENKTTRETETIFCGLDPDKVSQDKERQINENQIEIRFVASTALMEKLKRFKELDSHVNANPAYCELFERLVDLVLKQKERKKEMQKSNNPQTVQAKISAAKKSMPEVGSAVREERSRTIPIAVKRAVLTRDQAACTFKNPVTGKTCGSTFRLQFDHIKPFAKNGDHSTENIRILCQNHNLLMAEKEFGWEKIRSYH